MDIAATILAGLTLLSVPFLLWFGSKARARRGQEVAAIKELVEERSRLLEERSGRLTELHSRLDTLEKRSPWREATASEEGAAEERREFLTARKTKVLKVWFRKQHDRDIASVLCESPATAKLYHFYWDTTSPAYKPAHKYIVESAPVIGECLAALETTGLERPEPWLTTYLRWVEESKADPEWLKDVDLHGPTGVEELHRKSGWRHGGQRPLAGLSY